MTSNHNLRFAKIPLNFGTGAMPALGFGTLIPDLAETRSATTNALRVGFRHLDCAERYRNERAVGELFGWPRPRKPFRVLVAGAAPIRDAFAAQEGEISLHTARHRALRELAIRLAVALAVQDVRAQRGGIELRGDGRQAFVVDGRHDGVAVRAVKPFAQPDVIHVIIFHTRREQLADDFWKGYRSIQSCTRCFSDDFRIHNSLVSDLCFVMKQSLLR